jgi:hypothetical protein
MKIVGLCGEIQPKSNKMSGSHGLKKGKQKQNEKQKRKN